MEYKHAFTTPKPIHFSPPHLSQFNYQLDSNEHLHLAKMLLYLPIT